MILPLRSQSSRFFTSSLLARAFLIGAVSALFSTIGCSSTETRPRPIRSGGVPMPLNNPRVAPLTPYPWISWGEGESLGGSSAGAALSGIDQALGQRNVAEARRLVSERIAKPHTVDELARAAGVLLAEEKGTDALKVLSSYYLSKNLPESSVSGPITILFAYAYGVQAANGDTMANVQQSIAWFDRNLRSQNRAPDAQPAKARDGLAILLRTVETADIDAVREQWRDDEAVDSLMSAELTARSTDAQRKPVAIASLWAVAPDATANDVQGSAATQTAAGSVAPEVIEKWRILALLPLSGKYASLATSMRQGIELAAIEHAPPDVEVVVRDDAGSMQQATALLGQSNSANTLIGVLGPMTVDMAQNIHPETERLNIPQMSFARGKEFITGNGAYRFGLTPEAQVSSVLKAYANMTAGTNPTLVAVLPDDEAGREFADPLDQYSRMLGINLLAIKFIPKGSSSQLSALALQLEDTAPSAIFFGDNIVGAARFFSAFSTKKRRTITPLGSALWDDERALQQSRTVLEGAMFPTGFFADAGAVAAIAPAPVAVSEPMTQDPATPASSVAVTDGSTVPLPVLFSKNFQDRYSKPPNFLAAQGYDATALMLQGLRQVGEKRTVSLEGLKTDGVSGQSIVLENGEIERTLPVVRFLQGELHAVQ